MRVMLLYYTTDMSLDMFLVTQSRPTMKPRSTLILFLLIVEGFSEKDAQRSWKKTKDKADKGPEHLHGKVSFATKLATAGSDSGGGAKKHGKVKKSGPDLSKYAGLPDDITLGNLPKGNGVGIVGGSGGGMNSGNGMFGSGKGPEFPTWACAANRIQTESKIVRPTRTEMVDTEGRPIHAHGGSFLAPGQGGSPHKRWWWYGESAKNNPLNAGVNAYSSGDLLTWKYEGAMISQKTILGKLRMLKSSSAFEVVRTNGSAVVIVERPKVVYCPLTRKYVMWFHLDHRQEAKPHYHWRLVAVATAEHPNGPFHLHHAFHPSGLPSLDVNLYQLPADDDVGNKAHDVFLVRAIDNKYIGASKLRPDFLDVADSSVAILTAGKREAPALFRCGGIYRLLVTETDGWNPTRVHLLNGSKGLTSPDAFSGRAVRKNGRMSPQTALFTEAKTITPPGVTSSFDSQVMAVIQHCDGFGRPYYIYVGDRWNVGAGKKGIGHAGYVWLPLSTPPNQPIALNWRKAWDLYDPWNTNVF